MAIPAGPPARAPIKVQIPAMQAPFPASFTEAFKLFLSAKTLSPSIISLVFSGIIHNSIDSLIITDKMEYKIKNKKYSEKHRETKEETKR